MKCNLCPECFLGINNKGSPLLLLLEGIVEVFWILEEPATIRRTPTEYAILEYLERTGYIVTTEFPDPFDKHRDVILALPIGRFDTIDGTAFFCFGAHDYE